MFFGGQPQMVVRPIAKLSEDLMIRCTHASPWAPSTGSTPASHRRAGAKRLTGRPLDDTVQRFAEELEVRWESGTVAPLCELDELHCRKALSCHARVRPFLR
jgi:hypothetical protein